MAKTWNPNAPAVLGLEWLVTGGTDSMLQVSPVRELVMDSTQAETVTGFGLPIRDVGASTLRPSSLLEVFDAGDQYLSGPVTETTYRPTADVTALSNIGVSDWAGRPGAVVVDLWQFIDEPFTWPQPGNPSYLDFRGGGPPDNGYVFQVGSGAFPGTERVLDCRLHCILGAVRYAGTHVSRQFAFRLIRVSDGMMFTPVGGGGIFGGGFTTEFTFDLGEINPWEDRPWLPADMAEFAPGGDYAFRFEAVGDSNVAASIHAAEFTIRHMTENRQAVAMWRRPATQFSGVVNTTSLIELPAGTTDWAKPGPPARHCYRWRIPRDRFVSNPTTSTVFWRTALQQILTQGDPAPYAVQGNTVALNSLGLPVAAALNSYAPALNLTVAGSPSSDSQPYWSDPAVGARSFAVTQTQSVEQRFTPGASVSYLAFRFLASVPAGAVPDAELTLTVRRVSDNVQIGGVFRITAAEMATFPLTASGVQWRSVSGQLDAGASLSSGVQYALRWTVTAGTAAWAVPRVQTSTAGNPSFGGTSGCAATRTEPGGVATTFTADDIPAVLLQQPPAPANSRAQIALAPTRLGVSCFCGVDGYETVLVSWVPANVPSFAWLEIERYLDRGMPDDDWHLVFRKLSNTLQQDSRIVDREVPRGTPARYRLRYIDTNGSFSPWDETDFVTPEARGCEIVFTSNEQPDLTVVYNHEPEVAYDMLDYRSDVLMPVDGADYQMAFKVTERRGIAATVRIVANFGRQPCNDIGRPIGKEAIFEPLVRATRAAVPYLCVLDSDGNRRLAHVELSRATSSEPGWRYHVDATMTPLSETPLPVDLP